MKRKQYDERLEVLKNYPFELRLQIKRPRGRSPEGWEALYRDFEYRVNAKLSGIPVPKLIPDFFHDEVEEVENELVQRIREAERVIERRLRNLPTGKLTISPDDHEKIIERVRKLRSLESGEQRTLKECFEIVAGEYGVTWFAIRKIWNARSGKVSRRKRRI